MEWIYELNIFPVVQDQIRYFGQTNPPMLGEDNLDNLEQNDSGNIVIYLT